MAMGDRWKVLILPAPGNGNSYWEEITAVNPSVAKKLAEARIPSDWKVGSSVKRV